MASNLYEITDFSGGLNVLDSEYFIASNQGRVMLNVDVKRGAVETTSGFDLWNHDSTKTGGIKMLIPYYMADGTSQLVLANDDDYYYLENTAEADTTWSDIGDYGVAQDNPMGYVYDDKLVLGSGTPAIAFGAADTNIDISNPTMTTMMYTWDGTGTDPNFLTNGLVTGDIIRINSDAFDTDNNGVFTVTGSNDACFTVINSAGVAETDKVLGSTTALQEEVNLKLWNGSGILPVSTPPTDDLNIFEFLQGGDFAALFGAEKGTSTVHWCDTNDPDTWSGESAGSVLVGKNDGEGINGLVAQGDTMWVIKETRKYPVEIIYDEGTSSWLPRVRKATDRTGGTISQDTIKAVVTNVGDDLHMLTTRDGVVSFGRPANFTEAPISFSVSELINPIIDNINWQYASKARAIVWKRKYMLAVPCGASTTNNIIFVRNLDTLAWTIYDHISAGAFAIYKDSNGFEDLYVGDANEPKIYKANPNRFDVDNTAYSRRLKTGKFSFTQKTTIKNELKWIDIGGALRTDTNLKVRLTADSVMKEFVITKDQLLRSSETSTTVGSQVVGSEIVGGTSVSTSEFVFIAHIDIGDLQREFRTVELDFFNSGVGEYWKLDYLAFDFEESRGTLPRQNKYILEPIN